MHTTVFQLICRALDFAYHRDLSITRPIPNDRSHRSISPIESYNPLVISEIIVRERSICDSKDLYSFATQSSQIKISIFQRYNALPPFYPFAHESVKFKARNIWSRFTIIRIYTYVYNVYMYIMYTRMYNVWIYIYIYI